MKMMELAGEIGDGVLLNYLVGPGYNRQAMEALAEGAARAGRTVDDIDRPQLVVCSLDDDRSLALDRARELVAQYLGQQPHIMKASGVDESLLEEIGRVLTWPATPEQIERAMALVPDEVVQLITASGTPDECRAKVGEYVEHGCTCPVLYPLGDDVAAMIDAFARREGLENGGSDGHAGANRPDGSRRPGLHRDDRLDGRRRSRRRSPSRAELKAAFKNGQPHRLLPDKTLFMLFLDKSTRTRNAFESGMTQLGGHAIYLDAEKTQVAHGESPKDMGIILSRYGHGLAIRHDLAPYEGNAWMREIARWADIPLINLQCDVDHPTQTIADLMTLREQRGNDLRGLRVAVSWAYAPVVREAALGAAGPDQPAAAVRHGRRPRPPARLAS